MARTRRRSRVAPVDVDAAAQADLGENDTYPLSPVHRWSRQEDIVDRCVDMLHEKRRAVREAGLEALVGELEQFDSMDTIDYRSLTILERCLASLVMAGPSSVGEARLACRAVGLLALTVGSSAACSRDILGDAVPRVSEKVQAAASTDAATAVAALDCLAAVTFACGRRLEAESHLNYQSVLAICGVIKLGAHERTTTSHPEVLAAAVSACALLLATTAVCASMVPFRDLVKLLKNVDDHAVRMAAGEALAVCAERNLTKHASPEVIQALEIRVSSLASEPRGRGVDKKKHAEQKRLFQQIAAIMKLGDGPAEESTTASSSGSGAPKVSSWARLVKRHFLKRFLGEGFVMHALFNPLIQDSDSDSDSDDDDDDEDSDSDSDANDEDDEDSDEEDSDSDFDDDDDDSESNGHDGSDLASEGSAAADDSDEFVMVDNEDDEFVMV